MALCVMTNPNMAETNVYQRSPPLVGQNRHKTTKIQFSFQPAGGSSVVAGTFATPIIDGQPISAAIQSSLNKIWTFVAEVENHKPHYVTMSAPNQEFMIYPFIVNTDGIKFTEQKPYTAATRFERDAFKSMANGVIQVEYNPDYKRPVFNLKPRVFEKITTRLQQNQTYTDIVATNTGTNIMERFFVEDLDRNTWVEPQQKYFKSDVDITNGQTPPQPLIDGPFGVGTHGYLADGHINNEGTGVYWIDALGSFRFLRYGSGEWLTIVGKRIKPGVLPAPNAYRKNTARNPTAEERAFYDSKWEDVGTWAPDTAGHLKEPWAVYPFPDHRQAGWHEFILPNTRAHEILYINHLTAHAAPPRDPLFPPVGYVMPAEVRASDVVVWLNVAKLVAQGIPQAEAEKMMAEPWGVDRCPVTGRVAWSCFQSGYICWAKEDGSDARVIFKTVVNPTDGNLGISSRLSAASKLASTLRLTWQKDGPIGQHFIIRPQMISFDSQGNLIWGERYIFNIRKGNPHTGEVTTIKQLPVEGYGDKFQYDVFVRVDKKGVMGAVDDIFVSCWGWNTDFRYGKDGAELSGFYKYPVRQASYGTLVGPGEMTTAVGYNWPMDFNANHMIVQGTAGGSQLYRIFKREASDPPMDKAKFQRGILGYAKGSSPPMMLTHGPFMQNFLNYPDYREMGSWDDAKLKAYGSAHMPPEYVDDWVYAVRRLSYNVDYSGVVTPPDDHSHDQTIDFFALTPVEITVGETAVLSWGTTDATKVFIDGDEVPLDGEMALDPTSAAVLTFKLTTEGTSHTPVEATVTLTVKAKPQTEVEILKAEIAKLQGDLTASQIEAQALRDEVETQELAMDKLNESLEAIKSEESREEGLRLELEQKTQLLETKISRAKAELA